MNEQKTVTVAGVPVTVTVVGRELAVRVGRFDPHAAAGRLRVSSLSGTAAVAVYVAGEGGPGGTGERWVAGLYPAAPGAAEQLLLCDGCFQAATGLLAECQDGCMRDLDHDGLCLRDSPDECQWCGAPGRLHEVPRAEVQRRLPTVGEEDEGTWHLHYTDGTQGPFPSARDAWDYWHANGDGRDPRPVCGQAEGGTVKTRFDEIGYPLYCDAGPHEGSTRIDLTVSLYLSPQEYARYLGPESLRITLAEPAATGGTAEPSTERPAGDGGAGPRPARADRARRPRVRLHREGAHRWPSLNPVTTRPPASGSKATQSSP